MSRTNSEENICKSVTISDLINLPLNDLKSYRVEELSDIKTVIEIYNRKYVSEVAPKSIQLCNLNRAYNDKELVLVLGKGISKDCGLPDWISLLKKMRRNLRFY